MILKRLLQQEVLTSARLFPAVALVGPRQVGKTTLAHSLENDLGKPVIFLDLEIRSDVEKLREAYDFLKYYENHCIIIDEVQRMPELFATLRPLIDSNRVAGRFILLGSASPLLIRQSSDSLAGRIAYHELTPFSLPEIIETTSQNEHWLVGGFPEVLLKPDAVFRERWLDNFMRTFVERDLPELGFDVRPQNVMRLWQILAHLQGALLNISELSNSLGISAKTINLYLELLEGGFMIHRLQPYFVNIGKRLIKSPKIYIRETSLLHHLLRIRSFADLMGHPSNGASWEGYVIEQIRRVTEGKWEMYFYRTQAGAECDLFLIAPNGKRICIEIKLSNAPTISKGFYQSCLDLQADFKFIIVPTVDAYPKSDGIWVCSLLYFLQIKIAEISS